MTALPILWSFRRCPYAMRARMALLASKVTVELREIILREKPQAMRDASSKATVPVLQLPDGAVLEESLDIMRWALTQHDPAHWLPSLGSSEAAQIQQLIAENDGIFKHHLDRYKYPSRYDLASGMPHRDAAMDILSSWNERLSTDGFMLGAQQSLADIAIFPFVRQFANVDYDWFTSQPLSAVQNWLSHHTSSTLFENIMVKYPVWDGVLEPIYFP